MLLQGFIRFLLLTVFIMIFSFVRAQYDPSIKIQDSNIKRNIRSIGLGIQHGFIFAHSPEVENTKGSNPTGVELIFSWQRNDAQIWNLCNCYPRKGLLLSYYDYDNEILGKSFSAAYFLEPTYKLGKDVFFSFKGSAGLSYLTNPFDSIHNPTNRSYSTSISMYLIVGLGLWFRISDHWWLNLSANYQHESNGAIKQPNKGINWPTVGAAINYQLNPSPYFTGTRRKDKFWKNYSMRWDVGLFGLPKKGFDENGESKRLPLVGLALQGARQVGRINMITLGAEVYWDESLNAQLKKDSINASPVKAGILAGHEFILGKFLFSQRLGFYVFDQTPYYNNLYHRWGVQYRITRYLGIGFNLQAHMQVADFVDLRILYTFQRKYK